MLDYDSEKVGRFRFDRQDWKLYGFLFAKNGDSVELTLRQNKEENSLLKNFEKVFRQTFLLKGDKRYLKLLQLNQKRTVKH